MAKIFLLVVALAVTSALELRNGAYEDLVIKIADNVPGKDCRIVLENLEGTLTSASQYLFSALDSRAYLRSATVLLPASWPESCAPSTVSGASGETSDITVIPSNQVVGKIYTQQSLGCGEPGDQIYLSYESLQNTDNTLSRSLIKEFAMYRYGVFEEQGYSNDPIYPMCYFDDRQKIAKVTGCSDLPINENGMCSGDPSSYYNISQLVDSNARSSIMFAAEVSSVSMFCDEGNHDRFAPTKHNLMCNRRSVLDVVLGHPDFSQNNPQGNFNSNQIIDTTPKILYKKQNLTRYVFVIEDTKDMMQRESWSYLRLAMRQWATYVLPGNTEIGLVLFNSTTPSRALNIVPIKSPPSDRFSTSNRENFYSALPYTPSESMEPGCLHCGLKQAMDMLNDRTKSSGPANNVIVVIATGMTLDDSIKESVKKLKSSNIKVATINYPDILRPNTLRYLATETGGVDYTIFEQKLNVDTTLLTTYFELHNVLNDIVYKFYSGSDSDLPMEIHRREITYDGRLSITGSFVLDPNMSEPAQFTFFTHNTVVPLFKGLKLISPSHQVYSSRTDRFIDFKMITLNANWSESGIWTYTVEPYAGNPQPHFLQMKSTPISPFVPVVRTSFRTHRSGGGPLILIVEAKYGDMPILQAKVEVTVTKRPVNGSAIQKNKVELLDTGAGDPDITKGDGIYTRYFSVNEPGLYTFEGVVTNNDNTAYTWVSSNTFEDKPCCGSSITNNGVQLISQFERVLINQTLMVTSEDIASASFVSVGRIGDLKVQIVPEDMKAKLIWTSPDMGGHTVSRYEIRFAPSVLDILDRFETAATLWEDNSPYPLEPGSETTFNLDLSQNKELLDKPLYFAIKAYGRMGANYSGPISNYVRVLVPSPPPPPTVAPTYSSNEQSFWPNNINNGGGDPISPSITRSASIGLELILPVVIGVILLMVLLIIYCYFCVLRKRTVTSHKATKAKAIKKDNLSSTITIVPSTPQNSTPPQTQTYTEVPDPHQVGVPVNNYAYEDETKKRYSLVNQQEQQLIEELKQQQQLHQQQRDALPPSYSGLSVISNNPVTRNGQPLSPYNSWSASQLLHEHERRYSPMDNVMNDEPLMAHQEVLTQIDHMSINGQSMDHMSLNGHQITEHYPQTHLPPPVPPLPAFNNGYPPNYSIYGIHQAPNQQNQIYQSMPRNEPVVPFNPSLQGSMSSVNSGEKKRRNVTMV